MPLFYDCQRCTACCRWPGQVVVERGEIAALAGMLGLTEEEFIQRHTRLRVDRRGLALAEQEGGSCAFLDGRDCRVQSVKPQQCRDFPNRWNFPGFERFCAAVVREVDEREYARLVGEATGCSDRTSVGKLGDTGPLGLPAPCV